MPTTAHSISVERRAPGEGRVAHSGISSENTQCKRFGKHLTWICLLAAIALHVAIVFPMMKAPTNPMDEGMVLVYPELLSKGMIAQRDFESLYPPGNIWFLAGAYQIFGTNIHVERAAGVFYQIVLLSGLFFLFRSRGLGVAMVGCILSTIVIVRMGNLASAWMGGLAWGVWSLAMLVQYGNPRTRGIWAGLFAGFSMTWRADIAPALILAIGAWCILAKWRRRDILWLLLACGIALIPLMIHAVVVTPSLFFDNVFYTPVIRTHNGRSLPLNFSNAYVGQLYALIMISIMSALAVGWNVRRAGEYQGIALFAAGLFTLGVLPQALQRADLSHVSYVAALALPLLVFTGSFLSRSRWMPPLLLFGVIVAVPQVIKNISVVHAKDFGTYWVGNGGRIIGASFPQEQAIIDCLQANAKPNEFLFVGTKDMRFTFANDVDLYHLFPSLRPATYYLEFNPLSANRPDSRLAADLAKADWAVLDGIWTRPNEPNGSGVPGPNAPNEVIAKKFKLVYSAEPFELYKRVAD
jgi:hypothetical protein